MPPAESEIGNEGYVVYDELVDNAVFKDYYVDENDMFMEDNLIDRLGSVVLQFVSPGDVGSFKDYVMQADKPSILPLFGWFYYDGNGSLPTSCKAGYYQSLVVLDAQPFPEEGSNPSVFWYVAPITTGVLTRLARITYEPNEQNPYQAVWRVHRYAQSV